MAPAAKKSTKKGGKAKKWPLPPGHVASISELESYMNTIMHGPLRTGLEAVSGDTTLPTADALLLMADFLEGSKAGKAAIQERLDTIGEIDSEHGKQKGGMDNRARGEMDHAIVVSVTRAVEKTMMLRLGWKETDSPLLELSRQLMTEARAHAQSDPQHFLSPSIPLEESFSFGEFKDAIGEAVFHTAQLINTGSMLMILEYRLEMVEGGADRDSLSQLTKMVAAEGNAIHDSADEVAMMMMKAIKRQRRVGGMMTVEHRQEVDVGLGEVRDVLAGAVGDITSSLEGIKELVKMSASETRLKELEDAVDAEAAADSNEEEEGDKQDSGEGQGDGKADGEAAGEGELVEGKDDEGEAVGGAEGEAASAAEATAAAAEETNVVAGPRAMAVIDNLIGQTRSAMEHALQHLHQMVESTSYDKAADLFAEIASEERAIVKHLGIRKWQTKLELSQTSLENGILNVAALLRQMADDASGEPEPRSERGREVLHRPPPFFEALTLLTSATCRCIGDAERSVGVGLQQSVEQDLDLEVAADGTPEPPGRLSYTQTLEKLRFGAEAALQESINSTAKVANWRAENGLESIPAMLLRHQRRVCRALQRMQSRLMYRLQSATALPTVGWDAARSEVAGEGTEGVSREVAAVVPFIRASKELSVDLEGRGLAGDNSSHTEWGPSMRTSMAELERSCLHLQQEIEGFGSHILGSAAPTEPKPPSGDGEELDESEELQAGEGVLPGDVRSALLAVGKFADELKA